MARTTTLKQVWKEIQEVPEDERRKEFFKGFIVMLLIGAILAIANTSAMECTIYYNDGTSITDNKLVMFFKGDRYEINPMAKNMITSEPTPYKALCKYKWGD